VYVNIAHAKVAEVMPPVKSAIFRAVLPTIRIVQYGTKGLMATSVALFYIYSTQASIKPINKPKNSATHAA